MRFVWIVIALAVLAAAGAAVFYAVNGIPKAVYGSPLLALNASADKTLYHSAELMNFTMAVYSNDSRINVSVRIRGLNGLLNERRFFNLTDGVNEMWVLYRLPRCNVCGGIREGFYNITYEVEHENTVFINSSLMVEIRQ